MILILIYNMDGAMDYHFQYMILIVLPQASLCPKWSSNLQHFISQIQPVRSIAGDKILIYANECTSTFEKGNPFTWSEIPQGLNWISCDYYNENDGKQEYQQVMEIYKGSIFPMLNNNTKYGYNQGTILVPGVFGCNYSTTELNTDSEQIVITLNDLYSWSLDEGRIHGFNPYHFDNYTSVSLLKGPYGCSESDSLNPGAVSMPDVVTKLKEIGQHIVHS